VAEVAQEMKGIKVGDMVIHAKFAGLTYRGADGVLYRIMRMSDIVGRTNEMHDKSFRGSIPMPSSVTTE
jgi:co-chaperonin GroES (HSP10)